MSCDLDEIQRKPPSPSTDICCAGAGCDVITPPAAPIVSDVSESGGSSLYGKFGRVGKVMYTVGAVVAAYEFYHSLTQVMMMMMRMIMMMMMMTHSLTRPRSSPSGSRGSVTQRRSTSTRGQPRKCSQSAWTSRPCSQSSKTAKKNMN